jgi:nitrogen fixation-related uncharacterized protein
MDTLLFGRIEQIEPYIAITVAAGGSVMTWLCFLIWGWRTGQFQENEQAKHRVFQDELPDVDGRHE